MADILDIRNLWFTENRRSPKFRKQMFTGRADIFNIRNLCFTKNWGSPKSRKHVFPMTIAYVCSSGVYAVQGIRGARWTNAARCSSATTAINLLLTFRFILATTNNTSTTSIIRCEGLYWRESSLDITNHCWLAWHSIGWCQTWSGSVPMATDGYRNFSGTNSKRVWTCR